MNGQKEFGIEEKKLQLPAFGWRRCLSPRPAQTRLPFGFFARNLCFIPRPEWSRTKNLRTRVRVVFAGVFLGFGPKLPWDVLVGLEESCSVSNPVPPRRPPGGREEKLGAGKQGQFTVGPRSSSRPCEQLCNKDIVGREIKRPRGAPGCFTTYFPMHNSELSFFFKFFLKKDT